MPIFIEGLLLVLMIFCFCVGISIICQFARFWYENKTKPEKDENQKTTIYYAKDTAPEKTKKKKRRKKIDLAFKDLALSPDQFEIINENIGNIKE